MPSDPALIAETKAWLAKAASDRRAAEHALTARPPLFSDSTFHCQQAAEKAMKGFLAWHNVPFRRVHQVADRPDRAQHLVFVGVGEQVPSGSGAHRREDRGWLVGGNRYSTFTSGTTPQCSTLSSCSCCRTATRSRKLLAVVC